MSDQITKKVYGLNGTAIKLIAISTMFIDHMGDAILSHLDGIEDTASVIYQVFSVTRILGRLAFPLFIYMLVEGFVHTRNRLLYLVRLLIFGIISEIPFDLAFHGTIWYPKSQNVYFELATGLIMLIGFRYMSRRGADVIPPVVLRISAYVIGGTGFTMLIAVFMSKKVSYKLQKPVMYTIAAILCLVIIFGLIRYLESTHGERATLVFCGSFAILSMAACAGQFLEMDYHYGGILAIAAIYLLRRDPFRAVGYGCAILTIVSSASELVSFMDMPILLSYNGRRGPGFKYFFYAFYPVHLMLLYLAARFIFRLW